MDEVKQAVDDFLAPIQMSWNQLNPHKQAKISFLYMRRQHTLLLLEQKTPIDAAQMVLDSLDETNFYGKRLDAFVRKGGDIVVKNDGESESSMLCPYEDFVGQHTEWLEHHDAPTIFNHPDDFKRVSKPLLWLQEDTSTVCYLVSIACAIFYSQCMHTGVTSDDNAIAVGRYALNVSRFMRDEFTDEEVFANIFLGEGGYPDAVINSPAEESRCQSRAPCSSSHEPLSQHYL